MGFEDKHGYAQGTYENKLNNAGVPQSAWGDYGKNVNSDEYSRIVGGYSPSTVASDATRPTDLMGIQDQINTKYGVQDATTNVTDTRNKLRNVDIDVDDAISMSKLVGQRGKATDALTNQLQGYTDVLSAAQSQANQEFGIAQDERNKIEQLMLTSPNAGISYADTFESAVGKYNQDMIRQEEKELERMEKAQKDGDYDALFAAYGTTSSSRPSGMSKKEYLKELEKEYGSLSTTLDQQAKYSTSGGGGGKTYTTKTEAEDGTTIYRTTDENGNVLALRDVNGNELVYEDDTPTDGKKTPLGEGLGDAKSGVSSWFQSFGNKVLENELVYNRETGKMERKQ